MSQPKAIAPLISTSVSGPSGIMHLPRLWLKILLHTKGLLPEGYRAGEGGYDEALCKHFDLDRAAFVAFVATTLPDYMETERYVLEHAKNVSPETIASFNARLMESNFSDPARAKLFRDRVGIDDDGLANVIALNNLDDWKTQHELLTEA